MPDKRKPKRSSGPRSGSKSTRPTKDRVLQARIPQQLDEQLRSRADGLGLSVSTVVRNVLLNTFDLVEDIVADSARVTRSLQGQAPDPGQRSDPPPGDVIGWQEAVLNLNGVCDQCNAILPRGRRAAVGLPMGPRPRLLCLECLAAIAEPDATQSPEDTA